MTYQSVVIALPVADRGMSYDFYRQALGLEAVGELDESGIPEPSPQALVIPRGSSRGDIGRAFAGPDGHLWMVRADT